MPGKEWGRISGSGEDRYWPISPSFSAENLRSWGLWLQILKCYLVTRPRRTGLGFRMMREGAPVCLVDLIDFEPRENVLGT